MFAIINAHGMYVEKFLVGSVSFTAYPDLAMRFENKRQALNFYRKFDPAYARSRGLRVTSVF